MFTRATTIDYARIRAYPYAGDVTYAITQYLLDHLDENDAVDPIHLPRKAENLPAWNALLAEKGGPWVSAYGRVVLHPNYRIGRREEWGESAGRRAIHEALAQIPHIHGTPGGYPISNQTNFTENRMDKGSKGEDLLALTIARYADGLPVLNSVMWPKHDKYDFDHIITAGNRIAIVDAKFYARIDGPVVLSGPDALPQEDKDAWAAEKNAPRQQAREKNKAAEAKGVKYLRKVANDARWWDSWDGMYINGKLMSVAPVDGIRHLRKQFHELGLEAPEAKVFTAFNTPAAADIEFEIRGTPQSGIGSVRDMSRAAIAWVREAGDKADPQIVSVLHARLKESDCIGSGCEYGGQHAA